MPGLAVSVPELLPELDPSQRLVPEVIREKGLDTRPEPEYLSREICHLGAEVLCHVILTT